ncbi:hypothetical protein BC830DRAFT_1162930 [Chytriomyces sp. MP71]|nr:hypothetical protein BC830DRAFT_1162930 [Chytriomyces sp. MP71]
MQLDSVAKRQIASAVFVGIVALKMHQIGWQMWYGDSVEGVGWIVLLWSVVDVVFVVGLRLARVPRLTFSWSVSLLVALVLVAVNVGVGAGLSNALLAASTSDAAHFNSNHNNHFTIRSPQFKHSDSHSHLHSDKALDTADPSAHIVGSHVVNVVPPTLAKMNPSGNRYCIVRDSASTTTSQTIALPLQIKGTPPYTVDYQFVSLDGFISEFKNIQIDSLSMPPKRGLALYPISVQAPGVYRLTGLRDSTGMQGKVIESLTEVAWCPDAHWIFADHTQRTVDKCVDDTVDFSVSVKASSSLRGVQLYYSRRIESEEVVIRMDKSSSIPPGSEDILAIDDDEGGLTDDMPWLGDSDVDLVVRERVRAIQPRTVTLYGSFKPESAGAFFFRLLHVVDSRNNTVVFPADSLFSSTTVGAAASPPPSPASPHGNVIHLSDRNPDIFVIDSHAHPTIRFAKSDAFKIRAPLPNSAGNQKEAVAAASDSAHTTHETSSVVMLPLLLEGDATAPWTYNVSHSLTLAAAARGEYTRTWTLTSDTSLAQSIPASQAGVYTLTGVRDAFCVGAVGSPHANVVQETFPPTIRVSAEAIEQSCVGTVGALVNVSLTGDAPFWIGYDEVYRGKRVGKTAVVGKLRDTLQFRPSLPGTYLYEFQAVGDATYTEGIPITNVSITQIIHPQSEARFANPAKLTRCTGDSATLPVTLMGSGPWRLTYEIIFENRKDRFSVTAEGDESGHIDIITPEFDEAGVYVVDLIEITDANGCSWLLETPDVSIEVLAQRPSAAFNCLRPVHMLEGDSALLPVSLSGRQPFNIKYINSEIPSIVHELRDVTERDTIRVRDSGTYQIIEVSDMVCSGTANPVECKVKTIPKPKLEIPPNEYTSVGAGNVFVRKSICEGVDDSMEVLASGKAPFSIKYSIDSLDETGKKSRVASKEEHASGRVGRIPLITDKPNTYLYTFNQITDDNYRRPFDSAHGPTAAIQQTILGRPTAAFVDGRERVFQCLGDNPDDANSAISVQLEGVPPFDLTLELKHENHPREVIRLTNVTEKTHRFRPPTLSATGRYAIQLVALKDGTGCERVFDREDGASGISVAVSDVARIAGLNPESVCVGDVLSYTLQGTPPFTITYEFDGVEQEHVQIVDPLLTLYAAEPGTVTITGVCNHMNCCTRPSNLTNVIYNLPSAIVDGGKDVVEDIREGDETVIKIDFLGEPPFSFTYARRDLPGSSAVAGKASKKAVPKAEETFTITNIESDHYEITTNQEGLFHVTAVYDKHCGFPRVLSAVGSSNAVLKKGKN